MNAERLNTLCIEVNNDITSTGLDTIFTQLVQSLTTYASNPAVQYQQAFSQSVQSIYDILEDSRLNDINPIWVQLLKELYGYEVTGIRLKENIQRIVERNNMTPAVAMNELNVLHEQFNNFNTGVKQLVAGFEALQIGTDDLEQGKCELGILIPRNAVNFQLRDFGVEVERLDKILSPFTELATGSRDGHKLRTIASSDFLLNIEMWANTAKLVAEAIIELVGAYVAVVKVREMKQGLVETGASDQTIESVEEHANSIMKKTIDDLTVRVVTENKENLSQDRENELRTEIKVSLGHIANRIDRGYHFEVRVSPLIEDDEDEKISKSDLKLNKQLEEIDKLAKELEYHRVEGEPILHLEVDAEDDKEK